MLRLFPAFTVVFLICGCALPAPEFERQSFIPRKEVLAASLFQEGSGLYQAGRYVDAELKFRQVDYLYPNTDNTKVNLALSVRGAGSFDEAVKLLLEAVKRNPDNYDYQFYLAETYYRAGKFDKAIASYEQLFGKLRDTEKARAQTAARTLSAIFFELGRERDAVCYSAEAVALAPSPQEMLRHSKMLIAFGDASGASKQLQDFFISQPALEDPVLWKQKSLASIGVGDVKEAATYFDLAASKSANAPDSELVAIGSFLQSNGVEGALGSGIAAAAGTQIKADKDEEHETELDILGGYNPLIFLYWPPRLVAYVAGKVEMVDDA